VSQSKSKSARKARDPSTSDVPGDECEDQAESSSAVSDAIRRMAGVGLAGFFTTESALRKALGETVPKDWVDFVSDQSDRTRQEFMDRIVAEFGKALQGVDTARLMSELLEGRSVEVKAEFRLGPRVPQPDDES
jgi:hypothetical protein